jgi:hypothetical protein
MERRAAFGTTIDLPGAAAPGSEASAQRRLPSPAQLQAAACASGEYALRLEAGRWSTLRLAPAAQPAPRLGVPVPQAALVSGGAKVSDALSFGAELRVALLQYLADTSKIMATARDPVHILTVLAVSGMF